MNGGAQTEADVQRIQQEEAKAEAAKAAKALAEVQKVRSHQTFNPCLRFGRLC